MTRHIILIAVSSLLAAMPAMADAIDGDWCAADGRSMTIQGPSIRIPSGAHVIGEYSRHVFRYVGPPDDPESGHDIRVRIFSDDDMQLERIIDGVPQPEEMWHRCKPIA